MRTKPTAADLKKADAWLAKEVGSLTCGPRPVAVPADLEPAPAIVGDADKGWRLMIGERAIAMPKKAVFDDSWAVGVDGDEALVATSEDLVLRVVLASKKVTVIQTGHVRAVAIAKVGADRFLLATPGLSRTREPRLQLRSMKKKEPLWELGSPVFRAVVAIAGGPLAWVLADLDEEAHPAVKSTCATRLYVVNVAGTTGTSKIFYLPGLDYQLVRNAGRTLVIGHGRAFDLGDDAATVKAFAKPGKR